MAKLPFVTFSFSTGNRKQRDLLLCGCHGVFFSFLVSALPLIMMLLPPACPATPSDTASVSIFLWHCDHLARKQPFFSMRLFTFVVLYTPGRKKKRDHSKNQLNTIFSGHNCFVLFPKEASMCPFLGNP